MSGRRRRRDCRTGKVRYPGRERALHALHRIQNGDTRQKTPCRVYECPMCHGWHLTAVAR